ncbi:MAG: hypothetical protein Q4C14_01240 [Bacillota bacterium]|nr:hypothetical protein [Bacillota bacterium]
MINNENIVEKALAFSAEAYQGKNSRISKKPRIIEVAETVIVMSQIDSEDRDMMAAAALNKTVHETDVTYDIIEAEFGTRIKNILKSADVSEVESMKRLPLKIKMLILAEKTAELRCLSEEYSYYREGLWEKLPEKDPAVLAEYYYSLIDVFTEFEEYDVFSEFERLVARLFVKHR